VSELVAVTLALPDWPWWGWVLASAGIAAAVGVGRGFCAPLANDLYRWASRRVTGAPRRWL